MQSLGLRRPDVHLQRWLVAFLVAANCGSSPLSAADRPTLSDRHAIDPAGIGGSLILAGRDAPADVFDGLLRRRSKDRLVVLRGRSGGKRAEAITERLVERAKRADAEAVEIATDADEATTALSKATAIWIEAEDPEDAATILTEPVREALRSALKNGATIGARGRVATTLAAHHVAPGTEGSPASIVAGLGLLPDAIVMEAPTDETSPLNGLVQRHPGRVGYEVPPSGALVVRGRRVTMAGEGTLRVVLPKCDWRDGHTLELKGERAAADLTALRLSAIDRFLPAFPPKKSAVPRVEAGTLIIIGGGGMPKGIIGRFVELAGGKEARIVVLPTAMPDPISPRSGIAEEFRKAGAASVTVLPGRTRSDVDGEASLKALREATGLWFGGGRQWRFADAYLGTEALELMHDVLRRDGVVMGSSAGASIQADYLARANPLGNRDIMAEGYERGLGFLPGVAVDQHFAQRRRFADMTSLVDRHPQMLGIGIDEATAIVVQGQRAEVVGRSNVHFYDRSRPTPKGEPDHQSFGRGTVYDLVERREVEMPPGVEPE